MPTTTKFADLARDPRFCLHTATVDTQVGAGDAKLWGEVVDGSDPRRLHRRDRRGEMRVSIWRPGVPERVVTKT